ncbi:histidine--tRNA ligase [Candidatus Oleimmundimicrobium sp.]|uniref:histidine--tRNA ligase n=1 Tax=Candidatus Oleimmundimicrobium sp. TaxID=3060597 RepID=UPI00271AFF60|nr:histidine--tRNA ligase [Candidatus Oleimmundimicrobium sp.]MDO8886734.1 histidine--tRNA ligase [Candidatus Oleimmundimicrobium sp.]
MKFKIPRGTSDVIFEKAAKKQYIEKMAIQLFKQFGYYPIVTPTFEHTELFQRGIGEGTDIVQKEMYTFKDKGGRSLTLRPEGTAPVVRAYLENGLASKPLPVKLYYCGQMFRYERPQAGRYREFWQLGVEVLGSKDAFVDAEVILLLVRFLEKLGLKELELNLNSMGCSECGKSFSKALKKYLADKIEHLCEDCKRRAELNPLRVFDCKVKGCQAALKGAPLISGFWCEDCGNHFESVKSILDNVGISYILNPALVRGFDYYTKTTFEIRTPYLGAQNALGGGGRYDSLVEEFGGPSTPAIGWAIGTERVIMAIEELNINLPIKSNIDVFIAAIDGARDEGFKILNAIREMGISADMDYGERSLKGQMKLANKLKASNVIILGPDELNKGLCLIRDMNLGEQSELKISEITRWAKDKFKLRKVDFDG